MHQVMLQYAQAEVHELGRGSRLQFIRISLAAAMMSIAFGEYESLRDSIFEEALSIIVPVLQSGPEAKKKRSGRCASKVLAGLVMDMIQVSPACFGE